MSYLIVMDASADIDSKVFIEEDIRFIPMQYSLNEEMRESKGIESEELLKSFYDSQRSGELTKTTQITPYQYINFFSKLLNEGYSILYLSLSSGLSSTYQSAMLAASELNDEHKDEKVYVVDSLGATGGIGVLLELACKYRKEGKSIEENCALLNNAKLKLHHFFMVQDLMYLKRGGRVSGATAVVGTVLGIKPILKIDENGKLVNFTKRRGNKLALEELAKLFNENYELNDSPIYIVDGDAKELGDFLASEIKKIAPNAVVKRNMLSPIIGAHTGPGLVAVCFIGK
ncbi:MAG: DegV family protein [Bacilli bacterium]|nr:DegV family protein [Bacilli bacterium]MDY5248928.1 DegV family protein [Bacilli bacterium]MDY5898407.1 DegV family protein [Bacilli bacterium]